MSEPFWNRSLADITHELGCSSTGLSTDDAHGRLKTVGPNRGIEGAKPGELMNFIGKFKSPLVLLLLAASAIMALTGDSVDCGIVMLIVLLSVSLDYFQERQANRAVDALRRSIAVHAVVIRDGLSVRIPVSELVPGDVLQLAAGDLIPIDGRILTAKDFFVNQTALTGEAYPVEKHAGELLEPSPDLNDAYNAVFAGGSVISGMAVVLTCRTGRSTEFGQIALSLNMKRPATAFDEGIRRFGILISRLTGALVVAVLLINWSLNRSLIESALFSIALAVGLTPELLPMIITVTLSRGAIRMARRGVIIKQLESIQNLGGMDILCTDKTGTLTLATIALDGHLDCYGRPSSEILFLAHLNSHFETGLKSALDDAILSMPVDDSSHWTKIDEVPFDFERRRVSVLVDDGSARMLIVKGAPEDVLAVCDQWVDRPGSPRALDDAAQEQLRALHDRLSAQGKRLLGVAYRPVTRSQSHATLEDESKLIFAGYLSFLDPPKPDANSALEALRKSGVAIKVISGDNELVTQYVCQSVGLPLAGMMTGPELAVLDDLALAAAAERSNIFCRVTPAQKSRIIRALKLRGHTVGFLGDGINDAPSMHVADVGISVESAVEVAKAAAQVVLLKSDLGVLNEGVLEGRRTFGNVMKYILMATSSNFGNMFSMAGAALLLPFLPMLPVQILLNNLLYDVSELALPFDRVDAQDLATPQRWDMSRILRFMWVLGPISSLFDFVTFFLLIRLFRAGDAIFHTAWFVESIATQVLVIFIIRTRGSPLRSPCSPWLVAAALGVLLIAIGLPYTAGGHAMGFVALNGSLLGAIAAVLVTYLFTVQLAKSAFLHSSSPSDRSGSTTLPAARLVHGD